MKTHVALSKSEETKQLCAPLNEIGVNSFVFVRSFDDNSLTMLSTRPDWTSHFLEQQYYHVSAFEQSPENYKSGFILWDTLDNDIAIDNARQHFNFTHAISLIDKHNNYCDMFHFAVGQENKKTNNMYINNLDFFKRFSCYFKDTAEVLIKEANKQKIHRHSSLTEQKKMTNILNDCYFDLENTNLSFLKANKFKANYENKEINLTHKECLCIAWLILGKSSCEIATILCISKRTVEEYIENVKVKLNCYKQTYLVYKLMMCGFEPYLFID